MPESSYLLLRSVAQYPTQIFGIAGARVHCITLVVLTDCLDGGKIDCKGGYAREYAVTR